SLGKNHETVFRSGWFGWNGTPAPLAMPYPFARHFSILFFCVLAGLFLAAVITWQMPKRYTSSATVQIRGSAPLDPALQKEIIGRSDILQAVMENLGLEEKWNTDAAETLRRLRGG